MARAHVGTLLVAAALVMASASASSNGCLWTCDVSDSGDEAGLCVFEAASQAAVTACNADLTAITTINEGELAAGCSPADASSFAGPSCNVFSASNVVDGTCGSNAKTPAPMPLTNGDCVKAGATVSDGQQVNWALIQAYGIALRRKIMFHPSELAAEADFNKWTKPLTDCHIKLGADDASGARRRLSGPGAEMNTAAIRQLTTDLCATDGCAATSVTCGGNGPSAHNFLLQYLEEAVIDLGCLVDAELQVGNPDRCASARTRLDVAANESPDCWVAGWEAIFGVDAPAVGLSAYTGPQGVVAASDCGSTPVQLIDNGAATLTVSVSALLLSAAAALLRL